ncbi:hypothetical protein NXX35_21365 [Bacteroides xylanisolvens]|nr:hypothetical protein NXX35_21365 [Bacteroides xylanisolvens]
MEKLPLGRGREADVDARQPVTERSSSTTTRCATSSGATTPCTRASSVPPDKVGNLYREDGCKGREYDRGGRLLWDGEYHYRYDCEGNLVHKSRRDVSVPGKQRAYRKEGMARYAVLCG